jgi:hypothetical protein
MNASPSKVGRRMSASHVPCQIQGITILCDILRPDGQGNPGGTDRPATWLFNAVRRQLALAAGLPVSLLTPSVAQDLAGWLAALRPTAQADAIWASAYADLPIGLEWSDALERRLLAGLRNQFCIGYELPPYLVRLLDRHAIPYVDIRLHPVRFMDDLLFAVRAAHPATQSALAGLAVPEEQVIMTAGLREAMCQLISQAAIPANTLLVLGQRPYDSTQIVAGGFFDAVGHRARIAEIRARHGAVVLKPHPHDPSHSLLTVVAGLGGRIVGPVNDNIYRLFAMPEITSILTVSSSAAYEAPYFGKTVYTLADLPIRLAWRGEAIPADAHASLDDIVLSTDFWRTVLAPHTAVTAQEGVRLAPKPNRLRIALDSFWNFNEIDTDRLPARRV